MTKIVKFPNGGADNAPLKCEVCGAPAVKPTAQDAEVIRLLLPDNMPDHISNDALQAIAEQVFEGLKLGLCEEHLQTGLETLLTASADNQVNDTAPDDYTDWI